MYCQWCAKERDPDSIAVHHCGSTDRPPAYCMSCAAPLSEGATECGQCGTPAGQAPAPAPVAAAVPMGEDEGAPAAVAVGATGGAVAATSVRATRPTRESSSSSAEDAARARTLRLTILWASIFATFTFFIGWAGGEVGIQIVESQATRWWGPPSANLMFVVTLVILLAAILLNAMDHSTTIGVVIAVLSLVLIVFIADWLWLLRSAFNQVSGFWLLMGAAAVLLGASVAYVGVGGDD